MYARGRRMFPIPPWTDEVGSLLYIRQKHTTSTTVRVKDLQLQTYKSVWMSLAGLIMQNIHVYSYGRLEGRLFRAS